jgi:hypothetical protein
MIFSTPKRLHGQRIAKHLSARWRIRVNTVDAGSNTFRRTLEEARARGTLTSRTGMDFQIVGPLRHVETIASGHGIRELNRLTQTYGPGRWRKRKGFATVVMEGTVVDAELHWYEAHGIGRREMRIKRRFE